MENVFSLGNESGSVNYSYKMSSDKNDKRPHFINLVVQEIDQYRSIVIMKYIPEKKWLDNPNEFSEFTGEIDYFNKQGNFIGKTKIKGNNDSITTFSDPCPDPNDPPSSGGGGGSSGGSGGSSQPSTTCTYEVTFYMCCGNESTTPHPASECGCSTNRTGSYYTVFETCEINYLRTASSSTSYTLDPCDTPPGEFCNDAVGDPCPCNDAGTACAETAPIPINVSKASLKLMGVLDVEYGTPESDVILLLTAEETKEVVAYLQSAGTTEGEEFAWTGIVAYANNEAESLYEYNFHAENNVILVFEQDYRNRMKNAEKSIFDNLSRFQQLEYLHSAYLAQEYALIYFENTPKVQYNGKGDAFRHTLWNALGTAKLGETLMEQLTNAHEIPDNGTPANPLLEKNMDLHNNQVGRNIGSESNFMLMMKVKSAVDEGETKYLNPTNLNGTIIPNITALINTDE